MAAYLCWGGWLEEFTHMNLQAILRTMFKVYN